MHMITEDTHLLSTTNQTAFEISDTEQQQHDSNHQAAPQKSTLTPSGIRIVTAEEDYLLRKLRS